jgi:hypothetical protein
MATAARSKKSPSNAVRVQHESLVAARRSRPSKPRSGPAIRTWKGCAGRWWIGPGDLRLLRDKPNEGDAPNAATGT